MKMKYLLIAMISIAVSSCGGLDSKVKKLAERNASAKNSKEIKKMTAKMRQEIWKMI